MSQQDDLAVLRHRVDELVQRVGQLERTVDRLRGAGGRTNGSAAGRRPPERTELVTIPDVPYNHALWTDSDDEGLGVRDRHAP
ncbi:hypothetical protein [Streptomyces clavuligerus]|uniref:Uncharacterized protein n=1 Tax=Streptomyces clavuligerus TaxID=1901 RepID=B5GTW9_STRCL|nr:hypothetical protein [Streptomyces clavuligerus]ANW18333.1 hypothetical protein BB341_08875 [Streptomyces clavuligerus]AXU12890.1 hypothetical protein D1794_09205 [Streptomyces clavuligerus]EDY49765.1 conserved hypothetical protein [Streptomyces clavuligerus]EFG09046.1 Hypothetical protein SCLAV_3972 [Streptomyces clavuligerus]MBY6302812.1 hypothetical protein [Streptomyces clavuligerus]